ncbi:EamA family transporter [Sphingobacterium lactis]|uniref:Threonine/homoserine efflux transporter RhtA n=1 Tax=Sphingobacterium lactis TaxID=797291 RepID=A0A1H6CF79_9SPHI|nr:EamA family transporter [Sphingobacterium lactis]SEG71473.1 Threonine/homoserine efflux transporter RhtA [Sphingobacterium lactis]
MNKTKGAIAVFLGAASFGILSTFVKKAYEQGYNLAEVTGIQALLGALFLWLLWGILSGMGRTVQQQGSSAKWKILLSGISTGTVSILYYKCVQLVPASLAIVLLMQYIWIGQIIEMIFFKEKPQLSQIIVIVAILAGTVLATGMLEEPLANFSLEGIIYGMLAATAYSVFMIVNGRVGNDYHPIHKSAMMITGAFVLIAITLQPVGLLKADIFTGILPYGLLLALFGTVIPPLLFAYGMPKVGYSLGAVLSAVELPVAVCMSYLVLHESVSWLKWIGVLFILLTIFWKNKFKTNQ